MHSDHVAELFNYAWLHLGSVRKITPPLHVYGPGPAGGIAPAYGGRTVPEQIANTRRGPTLTPGVADYFDLMAQANATDLNNRYRDAWYPNIHDVVHPHEISIPDVGADPITNLFPRMDPFPVFEDDRVKVTAILAAHPPVFPAFAFRFDTDDGSVVFSGDTTKDPNVMRLAKGADVLVHEVIDISYFMSRGVPESEINHHRISHTVVEDIPSIGNSAEVKTIVLSHIVPGDKDAVHDSSWRRRASRGYDGKVIVGNDLDIIPLKRK